MDEEQRKSPISGKGPEEEYVKPSAETKTSEAEPPQEAASAPETMTSSDKLDAKEIQEPQTSHPVDEVSGEAKEGAEVKEKAKASGGEPPVDWFEPLEEDDDDDDDDDDANSWDFQGSDLYLNGRRDPEEESLAGESVKSENLVSSEKQWKRMYHLQVPRRKRSHPDEGWDEWPALGDGWKRKEVVRRSGSSVGQKDVYYLSPQGDRVRSRVELASYLEGVLDISQFDYKSGKFYDGDAPIPKIRTRMKRKIRERSSSESSMMERGEGADTPDSYHRLTPSSGPTYGLIGASSRGLQTYDPLKENIIKLPSPSSSRPLPSINGEVGSEDNSLICAKCGASFTGTWYDRQRKRPCCPNCWAASKTKEHPMIRFRKWIPCGQCVACRNPENCGQCANCKHGLQSPEARKRICRKRKCICPIRKQSRGNSFQKPLSDEAFEDSMSFQNEVTESQPPSYKNSDTENFAVNVDVDDEDDLSTDDDDDWHKKRKRRSCGECNACLCRKDCGTCDFCIDKPKFGGSNKKRQKCRLRQCQRQAMRHLLPFQSSQPDYGSQDIQMQAGRPRPHYTYSRKNNLKRNKGPQTYLDFTDNEDDDSNLPATNWSTEATGGSKYHNELNLRNHQSSMQVNHLDLAQLNGFPERVLNNSNHNSCQMDQLSRWDGEKSHIGRDGENHDEDEDDDEEDLPMITRIFSLADHSAGSVTDGENQLVKLLEALRASALPILWYAIVVEGPQLQLVQCAKQSNMADTMVLIDPGFCYQVTVQKQPLLATHPLYDHHPPCLTTVTEVVNLLLGLEKYVVCKGLPTQQPPSSKDPVILDRASTCDFLVKRNMNICANCRALCG
ncbi:hypothetical protein LDENG_00034700 [Lucifuga dentata]|nr:hypothetical protein LDENG_00034700 [Lucifuga dentata]